MDFKLHQLSGSNIETIFNKAYLDAKLVDKDWCSIKGELEILIKAFEDLEIISFYHECSLPKELSEEEVKVLISNFNNKLLLIKSKILERKDSNSPFLICFRYDHCLLKSDYISDKTLVHLSRKFEEKIEYSYNIYRENNLKPKKNNDIKKIPDAIDLSELNNNTFGFKTHDEFFSIQEISYITETDIKALEEVILELDLKIDSLYSEKEMIKIKNFISEKQVHTNNKLKEENITLNNKKATNAIELSKSQPIKYVREDYLFSEEEIASIAGKSKEAVKEAISILKLCNGGFFNKKESLLLINYLAETQKNTNQKNSVIERSKTVSKSEVALIIGGTALIAGGLAWYFTRNKRAAKIAAGMVTSYISSSWQYSHQNNCCSYSSLTTTRNLIRPSVGEIIYNNSGGLSPVYTGPRGGRYTIGNTGKKRYF